MKPFFSVIIPTLNEEKYLPKLLKSLEKQKEKDFEVIVVDGESEDKTIEKAREFEEKFNKSYKTYKIISSSKRNVSYQRNLGAKEAAGKYLAFFDADVVLRRNFLWQIYKVFRKSKVDFLTVWAKPDSFSEEDEIFTLMSNTFIEALIAVGKPIIPGYCFLVKRRVFEKVGGFDEEIVLGEDYELATRLCQKGYKLLILRKPRIIASMRRYRKQGKLKVVAKMAKVGLYLLWKGNSVLKQRLVDYPMGGKAHEKK